MSEKPVNEMTMDELREEVLRRRASSSDKYDRAGAPIRAGSVCVFYAAPLGNPELRVRVVDTCPALQIMVDVEILEILADLRVWRDARSPLRLPAHLLAVEIR